MPLCLHKEEILAYKVQGFPFLYDKRKQEQNVDNLDFVENSNFIRGSTEAVVHRCSSEN